MCHLIGKVEILIFVFQVFGFYILIFDILISRSSIIMYHLIVKIEILIFGFKVFGIGRG